ncbi:uncharacterized protein [Henckelia pumila]|uniref:uncharacterized protein n=1 Tax=Henckelia pumila TaxID=405737 RepID=UPI003C6E8D91
MARGDVTSVGIMLECVDGFGRTTRLKPNAMKCNIFMAGVEEPDREEILRMCGFRQGSLPTRYLGIPLVAARLREADYGVLVGAISAKIASWPRHTLSYAGKLELIGSVVQGMECFWLSVLPIPSGVIDKIETVCRGFMWTSRHPPIAWRRMEVWVFGT